MEDGFERSLSILTNTVFLCPKRDCLRFTTMDLNANSISKLSERLMIITSRGPFFQLRYSSGRRAASVILKKKVRFFTEFRGDRKKMAKGQTVKSIPIFAQLIQVLLRQNGKLFFRSSGCFIVSLSAGRIPKSPITLEFK